MTEKLKKSGEISLMRCDNGLIDAAMPIIIKRKHIATLISGQVFFQPPDMAWFKEQAKKYDFDTAAFLEAASVPIFAAIIIFSLQPSVLSLQPFLKLKLKRQLA